jgi:hypothetical protein
MARHKDVNWNLPDRVTDYNEVHTVLLMDIRDELKAINRQLGCYRIPRALDALHSMGVAARRRRKKK